MSQLKSRPAKGHSRVSNEKLSSDQQKQKTKNLKRQYASTRPARKVSPHRNERQETVTTNGVDNVEDLSSKREIDKINLKILQKIDGGIAKILDAIPHAELYQYKSSENMWERTTYEGTLFVYLRDISSGRSRGFVILNRLNSENTQEHILAGMEFREQYPFLLYKRESGGIFGLCIKDEQNFKRAGELLNRLSDESSSPASYEDTSPLSSSPLMMGGSQSPVPRTDGPSAAAEESSGVCAGDMDLQELTGRNYLGGQCFSDDTEGSVEGAESSSPIKAERKDSSQQYSSHSAVVPGHSVFPGDARNVKSPPSRSSPKAIPMGMPVGSSAPQGVQSSSRSSHRQPTRSPDSKNRPSNRNQTAHHLRTTPKRAASLEEERGLAGHVRSNKFLLANGMPSSLHESLSCSTGIKGTVSSNPAVHPIDGSPSARNGNTSESIVKKLFPSSTLSHPSQSATSSSNVMSPAVQTLFSRANNPQPTSVGLSSTWSSALLSSSLNSSPHKLFMPAPQYVSNMGLPHFLPSAVSVDQLEKQMNQEEEEDSSTWPAHPMHGRGGPSTKAVSGLVSSIQGAHFQQPDVSRTLVEDEAKMLSSLALSTTVPGSASRGEPVQLLQPSAFSVPSSSTVAPSSSSVAASSPAPLLLPSSLANVATITVEPPTPIPSKGSAEGGFPAIPPLMHSPGMTAPPMSGSTSARTTIKKTGDVPKKAISTDSDMATVTSSGSSSPSLADQTPTSSYSVPKRNMTAPANMATLMSPQQFLESRHTGSRTAVEGTRQNPSLATEPLTKEQLQKALIYLIQNDEAFVDKIYKTHQVIVQSSATDQLLKYTT